MMFNNSLYGNYRTRKFTDIFPNVGKFTDEYEHAGIPPTLSEDSSVTTLYYLLYARYGNSCIASSDENQFKYKMWTIIYSYGPAWEKRVEIQKNLTQITL